MAYAADTPADFFNQAPSTSGFSIDGTAIIFGLQDDATPANRLLTHLTSTDAALSAAQAIYAIQDAIYTKYKALVDAGSAPAKFSVGCNGYLDPLTGEQVTTYTVQLRLAPTGLTANNS